VPNDPLTSSRYPAASAAPNVAQDIQNAVTDLADNTWAGPFATTTARDTAFSTWVSGGGTMRNGLHAHVTGLGDQVDLDGNWMTIPRIQQGKTAASLASDSQRTGSVTFPVPFATAPFIALGVEVAAGSSVDLLGVMTSIPTTTGFTWRVRERGNTAVTVGASLHWVAVAS
jgi:hypothetical protein